MIRPATCAICHKVLPVGADGLPTTFPFCSERCRQVDLFRWFDGKYAIEEPLQPGVDDAGISPDEGGECLPPSSN